MQLTFQAHTSASGPSSEDLKTVSDRPPREGRRRTVTSSGANCWVGCPSPLLPPLSLDPRLTLLPTPPPGSAHALSVLGHRGRLPLRPVTGPSSQQQQPLPARGHPGRRPSGLPAAVRQTKARRGPWPRLLPSAGWSSSLWPVRAPGPVAGDQVRWPGTEELCPQPGLPGEGTQPGQPRGSTSHLWLRTHSLPGRLPELSQGRLLRARPLPPPRGT